MLETAWESRWLPDSTKKKTTHESVLYRTDISEWAELITKPVMPKRQEGCVNLIQQGSAVPYNWFLPVISEFELIEFAND